MIRGYRNDLSKNLIDLAKTSLPFSENVNLSIFQCSKIESVWKIL